MLMDFAYRAGVLAAFDKWPNVELFLKTAIFQDAFRAIPEKVLPRIAGRVTPKNPLSAIDQFRQNATKRYAQRAPVFHKQMMGAVDAIEKDGSERPTKTATHN